MSKFTPGSRQDVIEHLQRTHRFNADVYLPTSELLAQHRELAQLAEPEPMPTSAWCDPWTCCAHRPQISGSHT